MPVVLRVHGFTVRIYLPPREHGPAHVHVFKAGGEVVIALAPVAVRDAAGMSDRDVRAAVRLVWEHWDDLMSAWRIYHDDAT